ncbi:MAG: hypothetical protein IKH04_08000 [Kiritimatiellae bacterium]|nr:hypothetical protein [Kiritimatiellia bacterium]
MNKDKTKLCDIAVAAVALFAAFSSAAVVPAHYSKLGIVTAARQMGKLEAMNTWIQNAGYWDEWLACQVFSDDYPGFAAITNAVVASGLATAEEIAAVLVASSVEATTERIVLMIEGDRNLREKYHGGRIGQYIVENEEGRLIRVDLYADSSVWTNGHTIAGRILEDPEAEAKRLARLAAERERMQAAWDAANLPPDLAALRARQREVERQNAAAEAD